ncbi:MAG: site-specific integrase [Rhodospirillales bacterium]|nr:site-specific integrase [Rhodospirillales bacterium]
MPRPRQPARLCRIPGRPHWYIRDGRTVRSTGVEDQEAAECFLSLYLSRKSAPRRNATIGEILDARLKDLEAAEKPRAEVTKYYHHELKRTFGSLHPEDLNPALLKSHWARRKCAPGSLREELLELRTALRWGFRAGWVDREPPRIDVPAKRPPRERWLSREEVNRLMAAAKTPHLRLFTSIAVITGARSGAILGLTWDRVDLERGLVDFMDPKLRETKKRRTAIPISDALAGVLRQAKQYALTPFVIEYMGSPIASVKRAFRAAAEAAGLPEVSPHVLKHTAISRLAEQGVPVDLIADYTATTPQTVWRIYRKVNPDTLRPVASLAADGLDFSNVFAVNQLTPQPWKGRNPKVSLGVPMVGATGIEPVTPTMST